MNPILLDLPTPIKTPRLLLRPPQIGDGKQCNAAVLESFDELHKWMPWATHKPTLEESEITLRTFAAKWILRESLMLLMFDANGTTLLGSTGFHCNWDVSTFEIGYWIATKNANQGFVTESTNALTRYAFEQLHARRVEIKCNENNIASRKVAEKLGYFQEGILKNNALTFDTKQVCNTVIYARYDANNLPALDVTW